jgi:hypothetical protein
VSPLLRFKSQYFTQQVASLSADAAALLRVNNSLTKRLLEKQHALVTENQQGANHAQPWASALQALENLLTQSGGESLNALSTNAKLASSLPITLVLSNQWFRYKIIPAMPAFSPAEKVMAVATHCFRESYGDSVDRWMIRVNPLPHGDSLLISAVDAELIAAIEMLCKKHQCKLKSIQPYLMSGFNAMRHQLGAGVSCLVQVETGRLTIALMRDSNWQSITATTIANVSAKDISADWSEDLAALISREMLLSGLQNAQANIYFSALPSLQDEKIKQLFKQNNPAWQVLSADHKAIAGYIPSHDQPYAMALSAVF